MFEKRTYHNPNEYTKVGLLAIPPGDHRVKIINVVEKEYGKSGLFTFEITLRVSKHHGLLWYRLTLDPKNEKKSNKRLSSFFRSFHVEDYDLSHYKKWIGKQGAVRVMHATDEEKGFVTAFVYFCLSGWQQDVLPPFRDVTCSVTEDLNTNLWVKYLNGLRENTFQEYYKLITELIYRDTGSHCFMSNQKLEHMKQVLDSRRPDKETAIRILLEHIDKERILARKIAGELSNYNYNSALQYTDHAFQGKATLLNCDSIEDYIRFEQEYQEWQKEESKKWEESFSRSEY